MDDLISEYKETVKIYDNGIKLTIKDTIDELKKPMMYEIIGNESVLEDNVFENIDQICELLSLPKIVEVARQKMIKICDFQIKPDIMVRHVDETMTIFEVKRTNQKYPSTGTTNQLNAVGQLLLYKNIIEEIIKNKVRLALIDNKIFYRTYCAFVDNRLPITLIDFQKDRLFVPYNAWG